MAPRVEFRLLGPVELVVDGLPVNVGHAKRRTLLAALLVDVNRVVPTERLIDRIWGGTDPPSARNVVSGYLTRLRRVFADAGVAGTQVVLGRRPGGYLLAADPDLVDLHRYRRLVAQARATRNDHEAADLFRTALAHWDETPLMGAEGRWIDDLRNALTTEHLAATLDSHDVSLRLGRHAQLVEPLVHLSDQHPLQERLAGQLMLALYRSGNTAEALKRYARTRRQLADALGTDPGHELRELHQRILRADPTLLPPPARDALGGPGGTVPRQLPHDVRGFTGRDAELHRLSATLPNGRGGPAVIWVVSGTAGIGKTATVVHWAHHVAHRFPDGQLFADLRGFHPHLPPLAAADTLSRFLTTLGTDPRELPKDPDEQAALYRSLLTGRRVLVVLDNVASADQVRPLLPGAPASFTIVTSRHRLDGLVALDGALAMPLGVLSVAESRAVLAAVGDVPMAGLDVVADLCGRLPLALRLAAARLLAQGGDVPRLVRELTEAGPLSLRANGDSRASVAAAFDLSYRALPEPARHLFRRISLIPGPDWTVEVAAALLGAPGSAEEIIETLAEAHLVDQHAPRRYRCHDLLRQYAAERSALEESDVDRAKAARRLYAWYLRSVEKAGEELFPRRPRRRPQTAASQAAANAWLAEEHENVCAIVERAADTGQWAYAWRTALAISRYQEAHSDWQAWQRTHERALAASRLAGDMNAEASVLCRLGECFLDRGAWDEATRVLERGLALHTTTGNRSGAADALRALGDVQREQGEAPLDRYERALPAARDSGDLRVESEILRGLGIVHREQGRLAAAAQCLERAQAISTALRDRRWAAIVRRSLGLVYRDAGELAKARTCYQAALTDLRSLGDNLWEAYTLTSLGDVLNLQAEHDRALQAGHAARTIARRLRDPASEAWAQLVIGTAQHGRRDLASAHETLRDCLARFGQLYDLRLDALTWYQLGLVARDAGDADSARASLHKALALFDRLGIVASTAKTRAALASLPPARKPTSYQVASDWE